MDEETSGTSGKRPLTSTDGAPVSESYKRRRLLKDGSELEWQASLGSSLAEKIEQLTVSRRMNARQVKKLLRAVLTNEDVVSAFRSYINSDLNELDTGELSSSSGGQLASPGTVTSTFGGHQDTSHGLGPRILTRALAHSIQKSLQGYLPANTSGNSSTKPHPRTILDMEFPDDKEVENDREEVDINKQSSSTGVALSPRHDSVEPEHGNFSDHEHRGSNLDQEEGDENYAPSAADLWILKRDRLLDLLEASHQSPSSQLASVSQFIEEGSSEGGTRNRSGSSDYDTQESDNESLASSTTFTFDGCSVGSDDTASSSNVSESSSHTANEVDQDDPQPRTEHASHHCTRLSASLNTTELGEFRIKTENVEGELDTAVPADGPSDQREEQPEDNYDDDAVYADFLRSLFTPENQSPICTPKKSFSSNHVSPVSLSQEDQSKTSTVFPEAGHPVIETDGEDDPDDPEFDIMAALEQVDREDFFYELRDDRAVRVSKLEAKVLQQDLRDLFSDDEDETEEDTDRSQAPLTRASTIYAVRSHCHRLLQQQSQAGKPTDSPSAVSRRHAHSPSRHTGNDRRPVRRLTADQLPRLQRQLGMHVQQLTTSFLCTYDLLHLRDTVCRSTALALKALISYRDQADGEHFQGEHCSFLWCCPALLEAVKISTDYAGLSMLPRLRRVAAVSKSSRSPNKQSVKKLPRAITVPLPTCLLRLFTNNPVWSYPNLLPKALPAPSHLIDPEQRKRIIIHASENALMLMGLADFLSLRASSTSGGRRSVSGSQRSIRCLPYRSIQKHLLPFRSLIQLRGRRTNLVVAGKMLDNPTDRIRSIMPLAMCSLIRVFSSVASRDPLSADELQQLADEVAAKALPNRISLFYGCISEYSPERLFDKTTGIPTNVGYETVLPKSPPNACTGPRSEWSKMFHDSTTDFVLQAECMWWSHVSLPNWDLWQTPASTSAVLATMPKSPNKKVSSVGRKQHNHSNPVVLKPEDTSGTTLFSSPLVETDPTFLPAIPVDITSEGGVVINRTVEPKLMEYAYKHTLSTSPSTSKQNVLPNLEGSPLNVSADLMSVRVADPYRHIHLPTVDSDKSSSSTTGASKNIQRQLHQAKWLNRIIRLTPRTLTNLRPASKEKPPKLPIPPLKPRPSVPTLTNCSGSDKSRSKTQNRRRKQPRNAIKRKPMATDQPIQNLVTECSVATTTGQSVSQHPVISPSVAVSSAPASSPPAPLDVHTSTPTIINVVSNPHPPPPTVETSVPDCSLFKDNDPALAICQRLADQHLEAFHCGVDRLLYTEADRSGNVTTTHHFFSPNCKSSSWYRNQPSGDSSSNSDSQASESTSACLQTAGRFLHRCQARGEATTADLIVLPNSIPLNQRQEAAGDEHDVRHARSLLDRCRAYLPDEDYNSIVLTLGKLNQSLHTNSPSQTMTVKRYKREVRTAVLSVINRLGNYSTLLDDFICLLTTDQAWDLRLLPNYLQLRAIGRVQRVLQELVPRGKRFWRRLRNLADSWGIIEQNNVEQITSSDSGGTTAGKKQRAPKRIQRCRLPRVKYSTPLSKTWYFLESTWRSRPVLMTQMSALLNTNHKPYSGFEKAFEESDCLARHPTELPRQQDNFASDTKPDCSDEFDGWEVCTELSAVYRPPPTSYRAPVGNSRRKRSAPTPAASSLSWSHRHCSCPCHLAGPGTARAGIIKTDGVGLRHCLACSLRVHHGILYMAECNFQLRHVHITWPSNFSPKSLLLPAPSNLNRTRRMFFNPSSLDPSFNSSTAFGSSGVQLSTRALLNHLARSQKQANEGSEDLKQLLWPPDLDMANHRVAITILPPPPPATPTVIHPPIQPANTEAPVSPQSTVKVDRDNYEDEEDDDEEEEYDDDHDFTQPTISWPLQNFGADEEAACFNTEAFFTRTCATVQWQPEEDRQLLEFCKAQGRYSSHMFTQLANQWIPSSPGLYRSADDLEERFKQLMQATLGSAFDSELFSTPRRCEDDEQTDTYVNRMV